MPVSVTPIVPRPPAREPRPGPAWRVEVAAVVVAVAAWGVFFAVFGLRGFNLREDGYLLALADRVLRGEVPYRDFAYIRPPLPIATAVLVLALAPARAVAAAGGLVAAQIAVVAILAFVAARDLDPSPWRRALYAAAGAILGCTGGLPPAPWHTVDGVVYATLAAGALAAAGARHSPALAALAGVAAAAAAGSKQGFVTVLAAGVGVLALTPDGRAIGARPWTALVAYGLGAAAMTGTVVAYLVRHGALAAAVHAIVWDPGEITREVLRQGAWDLLIGMHLPGLAGLVAGLALVALVAVPARGLVRLAVAGGMLAWLGVTYGASRSLGRLMTAFVIEPAYVLVWAGVVALLVGHAVGRRPLPGSAAGTVVLGACTLYASVWSYVGIRSSTMALPFLVPLALAGLGGLAGGAGRAAGAATGRRTAVLVAASLAAVSVVGQVPTWLGYTAAFRTAGLLGMAANPDRVAAVDAVVARVQQETPAGEPILSLVDFPALYLLARRPNATRVDWFLPQELTRAEAERALAALEARRPRVAVVTGVAAGPPPHRRIHPILAYLAERYQPLDRIGEFALYRLRDPS